MFLPESLPVFIMSDLKLCHVSKSVTYKDTLFNVLYKNNTRDEKLNRQEVKRFGIPSENYGDYITN